MATKLKPDERTTALAALPEWSNVDGRDAIHRRFVFADFSAAFGWMTRVAMLAEAMDHHPEWSNVYRTVDVTLATHDVGGLSDLDIRMATAMDAFAGDKTP